MTNVATQAINLADSGIMGHRVQCPMSVDDLNRFFMWQRTSGDSAPTGHFTPHEDVSGSSFSYILANTLSKYYTDIDGVTGGLNFGSAILDSNLDPMIRKNGQITANDIIMAYVIYKIYGSSSNPTMNVVFNLQEAHDMLPNSVLVDSIKSSLQAEEELAQAGAVNGMFQDLLSEDPTRFFDAAGKQIPGLFEVNSTETATGSWNFVENDRIELNVQFTFTNSVTVNSTSGDSDAIESKVAIPAGTTFKIRLQLLATNTPTAAAAIQKAYVAATGEELVRQAAANKEAAQKAADALALATQATTTAQTQAAAAQATYNAAVTRNAKQLKLVLAAQAALQAAQSALAAAQVSGNQPNIQQQNAAALAAEALLENQQAIADLAAAELQTAATALSKATTTLNEAQSAAAAASAAQAAANAAMANASLALEIATATSLASTIAAATAASDPLTQALESEKAAILDPQNLAILLAKANEATHSRRNAFNVAVHTFAHQTAQLNNYNSILYNMNSAIATGSNDSQLQLYKAMVIGASNVLNTVSETSQVAASTLAASYTAEFSAIQRATLASSNAASLSATVAAANTNSANRSLTAATTAYVYASTMNASAAAAAAEAQDTLNNRVSNGAVMTEVQTRTQALLDANKAYAAATSTMNGALAKMTNATKAYETASTIAVHAKVNISSVATSNLFYLTQYKTSVSTSSAYQANVLSNAKLNQIAIEVNGSLIRLNAATAKVATARANVSMAQLVIDTALAGGAILSEITVLKGDYNKAKDSLTQALLIQATAEIEYNGHTQNAANGQVQLLQSDATAFYNASITQKQLATDNIIYYSTLLNYASQQPDAFPPIDSLSSADVYSTQLGVWQTYLGNFETLASSLLTQLNTDRMRASTLMAANPSISTSLGSLSNYYLANSNSSHLVFQVNAITSLLASLSNVGLDPPDLEADLAAYSAQTTTALTDTATAYNTYLAHSLAAQSISLVSSVGQEILNTASQFQLAQISSATMNTKVNFYNSTLAAVSMLQLKLDQASGVMDVTQQALSNATLANMPPSQLTLLQQKYADAAATKATLANTLSGLSATVSTMNGTLFAPTTGASFDVASLPGLTAWYDAADPLGDGSKPSNGAVMSNWADKSSNAYTMTVGGTANYTSSLQNGLGAITLSGNPAMYTNNYLQANIPSGTFLSEFNAFVVYNNTSSNTYNAVLTVTSPGTFSGLFDLYDTTIYPFGILSSTTYNPSVSLLNINISQADVASSALAINKNGTPITISGTTTGFTASDTGSLLYLGTRGDGVTNFNGNYYEVIVFNAPLSLSQRQKVEGYLAWKWGIQAQLPSGHPYLSASPSGTSAPAPAPPMYQKPSAPGLQLWLDAKDPLGNGTTPANAAHLTTWADKSGNGYNGSVPSSNQYHPTCDPFVTYDASNSSMNMSKGTLLNSSIPPGTFSNAFNMFMVYKRTGWGSSGVIASRCSSTIAVNWPNPLIIYQYPTGTSLNITEVNEPLGITKLTSGFASYNLIPSSNTLMVNIDMGQVANSVNVLSNGNLLDTGNYYLYENGAYASYMDPTDLGDMVTIGGRGDAYNYGDINVNEVMLFNTELTDLQRQEVEGYLAWKWGLQAELPTTHPYFLSYPTFNPSDFNKVGPTGGIWTTIAMSSDAKKMIAAGVDLIYTSSDSGKTWLSSPGAPINWQWVCCSADVSVAYGMTYAGIVYKSTDGGVTWTALAAQPSISAAYKICCSSNGSILLIASFNSAQLSRDGGSSWTPSMYATQQGCDAAMSADGSVLYYTDYQVGVFLSINGGTTWTQSSLSSVSSGRFSIACSADGSTAITGVTGNGVYITRNKGATWTAVATLPTAFWFTGLAVSADGKTIAVSAYYSTGLYLSKDSGKTWTQSTTPTGSSILSIAINTTGNIIVVVDRDDGVVISASAYVASPTSTSPYTAATMLRQAELAVAKKNELIQQANNAYNNYSQLNDRLEAANQSTNSVLDGISVAMAKGANLSTIFPLQTQLSAAQEDTVLMQLQSANLYNIFLTLSTLITPDASFISTVNSTSNATFTATISARLNESAQQLQTAQIEDSAATTALAKANATLTLVSTQFSIKKQQGISAEQMAPLTSTFTAAALDSANKNILLNFTNTALAQAQSNYDSIYATYSVGSPSIYTAFANTSTTLVDSLSTLVSGQNKQISSLTAATSNVLTVELTNAYMGVLNYSTLAQSDYTRYQDLLVKYNTQMAGGNTDQIASIYADITSTYNKYVTDAQNEILYTAAYLSSLGMATIDPQSRAILSAVALNQTTVIQGARANELYENLQEANSAQFKLNNEFVSIQSAYTIAQSDLQIATVNDSPQDVLNTKYSTLIGISNQLTDIQIKYNLSQSATQLAKSYVNMNPNAQSILDTATANYLAQANLAQANVLVSQYNAAVANEKQAYESLQIAKAALTSAQDTFNAVIAAGADLITIQAARDAQNAGAAGVTRAALIQNNAMNALNKALENANLDQIAQSLIITARLTNENTTAGGAVNGAQVQLQNYSTLLATALATLNVAKTANTGAVSTLTYSIAPSVNSYNLQFVNDLYNITATTVDNATVEGKTITFIKQQVAIYGNAVDYKYLMFSAPQPNANFYMRLQDPGDSQNTTPWIMFEANNTFTIIHPVQGYVYYGPTAYTASNSFLIRYDDATNAFEYYMDNVLLHTFTYVVSNRIVWQLLNWLALSVVTIDYAGLSAPGGGMTPGEITDIQSAVNASAERAVTAQLEFDTAMGNFSAQARLVSSLTQTFSTTTGNLTINNNNNTLLYNGFVYNQTFDKYVLQKSFLPTPVISGSPFNLYSVTVNPIDMGIYNSNTSYSLGNLVYFPNSDGAQFMCGIAPDPRGP